MCFEVTASTVSGVQRLGFATKDCKFHTILVLFDTLIVTRYSVKGWCIRQAKLNDTLTGDWKEGDILYEVSLQRHDPVPMNEVVKRPTNEEVDDYVEYKRLRKLHREDKHKGPVLLPMLPEVGAITTLLKVPASAASSPQSLLRMSPSLSRTTTFKDLAFDAPKATPDSNNLPAAEFVSPMTIPDLQDSFFASKKAASHAAPAISELTNTANLRTSGSFVSTLPGEHVRDSLASISRSIKDELKEIIPWHEQEEDLLISTSSNASAAAAELQSANEVTNTVEAKAAELNPVKNVRRLARDIAWPSYLSSRIQEASEEDTAADVLSPQFQSARPSQERDTDKHVYRRFGRRRNVFDGAEYDADDEDHASQASASKACDVRSRSASASPTLHSPTPVRLPRPISLFHYGIETIEFASPLDNVISRPRMASPVNSFTSSPAIDPLKDQVAGESVALGRLKRWLSK